VQVRFEFVNPEHLALNSRSRFLYSRLWRPCGERIAGPVQALPACGESGALTIPQASKGANAPSDAASAKTSIGCSSRGSPRSARGGDLHRGACGLTLARSG
jgi:hypothetical protein